MDGQQAGSGQGLAGKIEAREALIGIIGLGYVGLPLAHAVHGANYRILGFDVAADKVAMYNQGVSPIGSVSSEALKHMTLNGRFQATADFSRLGEAGYYFDLCADAAGCASRTGHDVYREKRGGDCAMFAAGPACGAGKHHVSRHHAEVMLPRFWNAAV